MNLGFSHPVEFEVSTIQNYTDAKKYDLVLGVEILMHIPPKEILSSMNKLKTFSKNHLINVDFYEDVPTTNLAKHNFNHRYLSLYEEMNPLKLNNIKINEKQSLFHMHVKEN